MKPQFKTNSNKNEDEFFSGREDKEESGAEYDSNSDNDVKSFQTFFSIFFQFKILK